MGTEWELTFSGTRLVPSVTSLSYTEISFLVENITRGHKFSCPSEDYKHVCSRHDNRASFSSSFDNTACKFNFVKQVKGDADHCCLLWKSPCFLQFASTTVSVHHCQTADIMQNTRPNCTPFSLSSSSTSSNGRRNAGRGVNRPKGPIWRGLEFQIYNKLNFPGHMVGCFLNRPRIFLSDDLLCLLLRVCAVALISILLSTINK